MSDAATTTEERLARLEARMEVLEHGRTTVVRRSLLRNKPRSAAEAAKLGEIWRSLTGGLEPIGAKALRQRQIEEGADPSGTWAREEIERMRGE